MNRPDPETLIKLADFFECSVDYLIGRTDDFGNVNVVKDTGTLFENEWKFLQAYRRLNDKNKLYVEAYVSVRLEEQNKKGE